MPGNWDEAIAILSAARSTDALAYKGLAYLGRSWSSPDPKSDLLQAISAFGESPPAADKGFTLTVMLNRAAALQRLAQISPLPTARVYARESVETYRQFWDESGYAMDPESRALIALNLGSVYRSASDFAADSQAVALLDSAKACYLAAIELGGPRAQRYPLVGPSRLGQCILLEWAAAGWRGGDC